MNKTTTALTELIEYIDGNIQACTAEQQDRTRIEELERVKEIAISLLQKEREDIYRAYNNGVSDSMDDRSRPSENIFFNQSFTQYKTETNG